MYNFIAKVLFTFFITTSFSAFSQVTQADAGPDVNLERCDLYAQIYPNTWPVNGETAHWELLSGQAVFSMVNGYGIYLSDATGVTVWRYSITDGISTSFDTLEISVSPCSWVTQADLGADRNVELCEFPVSFHQRGVTGETVTWEVISGQAIIDTTFYSDCNIIDAIGTVELKQTITNGIESTSDTVEVHVGDINNTSSCDLIPWPARDLNCGEISKIGAIGYLYNIDWKVYDTGLIDTSAVFLHNSQHDDTTYVRFDAPGEKIVSVEIQTPGGFSTYTKEITINVTCDDVLTQADAGHPLTATCYSLPLSGNSPGAGETGLWTSTDSVSISNPTSPTAYISQFANHSSLELVWTITGATTSRDTLVVTTDYLEFSNADIIMPTCGNEDGQITAFIAGGAQPITYVWDNVIGTNVNPSLGDGTYTLNFYDSLGCQASIVKVFDINEDCSSTLFSLEGNAYAGTDLQDYGRVFLFESRSLAPVEETTLIAGHYRFENLEMGDYKVYVVPFDDVSLTSESEDYLPTYYVSSSTLSDAYEINLFGDVYSVDISLLETTTCTNSFGTLDIEFYGTDISDYLPVLVFDENGTLICGGVLDGLQISFDDLCDGQYYISVFETSSGYINSDLISVVNGVANVSLRVSETSVVSGITTQEMGGITTVPNPCTDQLTITNPIGETITCRVSNIATGEQIHLENIDENTIINTEEWTKGAYIIQLILGDSVKTTKVIKM